MRLPRTSSTSRGSGARSSFRTGDGPERTLDPARLKLIEARRRGLAALAAAKVQPCSKQAPNTVVLPPAAPGGPTLVYLLTPQPDLGTIPFGGHYRVEVAADGSTGAVRGFAKTCLAMSTKEPGGPGSSPVALVVSHVLDPVPTEIHVFSSLVVHKPVMVATMSPTPRLWPVVGARIGKPRAIK